MSGNEIKLDDIEDDVKWFYKQAGKKQPKKITIMDNKDKMKKYINEKCASDYRPRWCQHWEYKNLKYGLRYEYKLCAWYMEQKTLNKSQTRYKNFLLKGIYHFIPFDDEAILLGCPKMLLDDQNNYHSLTKPAVAWRDGKGLYYIHGRRFAKALWYKVCNRKLPPKDILKLTNIEQRYIAIQLYDVEELIKELKSKVLDTSKRGNQLIEIDLENTRTVWRDSKNVEEKVIAKAIKYKCPSTGRIYMSYVPPEHTKADTAMAWKFSIKPEEYEKLRIEA